MADVSMNRMAFVRGFMGRRGTDNEATNIRAID
jgi:hypothetical protein